MKGENDFEKEKVIAIYFSNDDGTVHLVQLDDCYGRTIS